jgi:hypothetical protein
LFGGEKSGAVVQARKGNGGLSASGVRVSFSRTTLAPNSAAAVSRCMGANLGPADVGGALGNSPQAGGCHATGC